MSDRTKAPRESKHRAPRNARAERAQEIGRRLIDAAAQVVGAEGYANASVAKITALADVAQGTFYNYFASQQDLFDHLLPELGGEMLEFIRERVKGIQDSFAREEAGFRAFFEFLHARPEFYRILNEAEAFSPKAFRDHMRNMAQGYLRALRRSRAKGELPGFDDRDLDVVVHILLAARNYIAYHYVVSDGQARMPPAFVTEAYVKLVTGGMRFGGTTRRRSGRSQEPRSTPLSTNPDLAPRTTTIAPGQVQLDLEIDKRSLDQDGRVRTPVLMELALTAAAVAAQSLEGRAREMETMAFSLIDGHAGARVSAEARVEGSGTAMHVSVRLSGSTGKRRHAVATAQVSYARHL